MLEEMLIQLDFQCRELRNLTQILITLDWESYKGKRRKDRPLFRMLPDPYSYMSRRDRLVTVAREHRQLKKKFLHISKNLINTPFKFIPCNERW
jgi:hypothetical protein